MLPLSDENPMTSTPWVTILLIVVNIAVFALIQPQGDSPQGIEFSYEYAAVPCEITTGQPVSTNEIPVVNGGSTDTCVRQSPLPPGCDTPAGRRGVCTPFPHKNIALSVLLSLFLHGSWFHVGFNMWFLWIFGNNVEDHLGPVRYLLFYLAAGVVAALAHVAIQPQSTVPLIGASGAIAGVMGAYLVWFPTARVRTLIFFFFIFFADIEARWLLLAWFVSQFLFNTGTDVAWAAHVGGFMFGVAFGAWVRGSVAARRVLWRRVYTTDDQGFWDARHGGRAPDHFPPYEGPIR